MASRTAYAWEDIYTGKFYLSVLPATARPRPRNEYATREALEAEAGRRRLSILWDKP